MTEHPKSFEHAEPAETCADTRHAISDAAAWLWRTELTPEPGSLDHNEFITDASDVLQQAAVAFESRPAGCRMERLGDDDCFECLPCGFYDTTDVSY